MLIVSGEYLSWKQEWQLLVNLLLPQKIKTLAWSSQRISSSRFRCINFMASVKGNGQSSWTIYVLVFRADRWTRLESVHRAVTSLWARPSCGAERTSATRYFHRKNCQRWTMSLCSMFDQLMGFSAIISVKILPIHVSRQGYCRDYLTVKMWLIHY